jgi:hypothetical protein
MVPRRIVLLVSQVMGQLGLQRALQHRFGQLLQKTVLSNQVF